MVRHLWIFKLLRGEISPVVSHKFRLILAPRPPMHFCHKTFPNTNNNIYHCSKFQRSGCLIAWLPNFRYFGPANWLFPFFSKNSAFLNLKIYSLKSVDQGATCPTMVWCGVVQFFPSSCGADLPDVASHPLVPVVNTTKYGYIGTPAKISHTVLLCTAGYLPRLGFFIRLFLVFCVHELCWLY